MGGVPFGNSIGATSQEIKLLGLYAGTKEDVEKARASARSK